METELKKPNVLLVDDDEEGNRLLKSVLQNAGFEVTSAFDGVEGLDMATKRAPDVIITGIVMPRMSGFDMVRGLKGNVATATIPVLVYSHLGREEDREEAIKIGVQGFLMRGTISPTEIVERVRALLPRGELFYLAFDPQAADAKRFAQTFDFPPYFECPGGKRMMIQLEGTGGVKEEKEFKAKLVCQDER